MRHTLKLILPFLVLLFAVRGVEADDPVVVCATVPDLGELAKEIGGDEVSVTVFAKGKQDPHFVDARPSFIRALADADLYLQVGLGLEEGWAPALLKNARNGDILAGNDGYFDASTVIEPLDAPSQEVDRSMGDVHPYGNPHYLLDPINGLRVARALATRLSDLRPASSELFEERYQAFRDRLAIRLMGKTLAEKYDVEKFAKLYAYGKAGPFLKKQGDRDALGGWFGKLLPHVGARIVTDHAGWPYFARRFGIEILDRMEPKPGIPPSTRHLIKVIKKIRARGAKAIVTVPYFDSKHAKFLEEKTDAVAVVLAHQVGAVAGADDYLSMIDVNIERLSTALGKGGQ